MTKIIGLTGGIGSGKTTVAKMFAEFGVPIYIADEEAKKIMKSPKVLDQIRATFGDTVFDGLELNRSRMASVVFNDSEKLNALNGIVHPEVRNHFKVWLENHSDNECIIYEAAILFESGRFKECDYVITVTAPFEVRVQRVIARDTTSREEILSRMKMQWNDAQRFEKSNFIINNVKLSDTKAEIVKILKILNIKQKGY